MIAIISDIHGNYSALKAVLAEVELMGISDIICLGDIGGYYCEINECCDLLREREIPSLMGNHDWYLVTGEKCHRSNSVNKCIDYQRNVISQQNLDWLTALEPQAQFQELSIVHGGWNDPIDEYVVPSEEYFSLFEGNYFASGHTHVPTIWAGESKIYCNPGSVGQPRDGDPRASFAVFEDGNFSIFRVEYNFLDLQRKMHKAGFPSYFYENLAIGARIGGKIDRLKS